MVLEADVVAEDVIFSDEVVALLFDVSDVAESLRRIETLIGGDDGEEKGKLTKADLERRRQIGINAERTRQLAIKAQAELDARKAREAETAD